MQTRFYTHFSHEGRRPYIEDHSLQLFYPDSVEAVLNVKQLYNNLKLNSSFVSSEYEASLQSLEQEFNALRGVAKNLKEAYRGVLKKK